MCKLSFLWFDLIGSYQRIFILCCILYCTTCLSNSVIEIFFFSHRFFVVVDIFLKAKVFQKTTSHLTRCIRYDKPVWSGGEPSACCISTVSSKLTEAKQLARQEIEQTLPPKYIDAKEYNAKMMISGKFLQKTKTE